MYSPFSFIVGQQDGSLFQEQPQALAMQLQLFAATSIPLNHNRPAFLKPVVERLLKPEHPADVSLVAQLILFEAMTRSEDSAGDKSQTPANSGGKTSATVISDLLQVLLNMGPAELALWYQVITQTLVTDDHAGIFIAQDELC